MNGNDPGLARRIVDLEWAIIEGEASPDDYKEYAEYVRQHEEWIRAQPWFGTWEMAFGHFLPEQKEETESE